MDIKKEGSWAQALLVDNDQFLQTLLTIPKKILDHHETEGLAQMVLHELGQSHNLGLKKAYFMVSSPDFNHVKGVAGFCSQESTGCCTHMWQEPVPFQQKMQNSGFVASMKKFLQKEEFHHDGIAQSAKYAEDMKQVLQIQSPSVYIWNLRNGNKGILIYEDGVKQLCSQHPVLLEHVTSLLGLCPL